MKQYACLVLLYYHERVRNGAPTLGRILRLGLKTFERRDILEQKEREFISKHVSVYAAGYESDGTKVKRPEREFFAECFAEYMTSNNPRDAAKIFGEIIETALGR